MKKAISIKLKALVLVSLTILAGGTFTGCQDEVDKSNRFTFTGDLISTYLEKYPTTYGHFTSILSKARIGASGSGVEGSLLNTLSTYGSYTCIAPVDEAVEAFVNEEYQKYLAGENTGVTSNLVSDLSVEKCTEIARNHIIESEFRTLDFKSGNLPEVTMNQRWVEVTSAIVNGTRKYYLENAEILTTDIFTENGTIHAINKVLNPSNDNAADILKKEESISIFRDALDATKLGKLLEKFEIDEEYDGELKGPKFGTEPGIPGYPATKNQKFTLLIEPNSVYINKGIYNFNDLVAFAESKYGSKPGYEDKYNHPYNALFKFVAYHIIDRSLDFVEGGPGGWIMAGYDENDFKSEVNMKTDYDWSDYFETYLPYSNWTFSDSEVMDINNNGNIPEGCMIKVTRPYTNSDYRTNIVINYCNTQPSAEMLDHTNIIVYRQSDASKIDPSLTGLEPLKPKNATIHFIDKILVYNEEEMKTNILKERMRWDVISCFPELTNNLVRWNKTATPTCTYIPSGGDNTANERQYSKRLKVFNSNSRVYYLRPHAYGGGYPNYQGDELLIDGKYDVQYRLPHVPEGTYEIRIGFSLSNARGVCQFFIINGKKQEICDIPVDMRNTTANMAKLGWFDDSEMSEKEISDQEKAMRNRKYMMAPASIYLNENTRMRDNNLAMRRIIGQYHLIPNKEGYNIRFKNVTENSVGENEQFNQDYLEIVPKIIYNNPTVPEDRN